MRFKSRLSFLFAIVAFGISAALMTATQAVAADSPYHLADGINCQALVSNRSAVQSMNGTLHSSGLHTIKWVNHVSSASNYACGSAAPSGPYTTKMPTAGSITMVTTFRATGAVVTSCTAGTAGANCSGGTTSRYVTTTTSGRGPTLRYAASGVGFSSICATHSAQTATAWVYSSQAKGSTMTRKTGFFC